MTRDHPFLFDSTRNGAISRVSQKGDEPHYGEAVSVGIAERTAGRPSAASHKGSTSGR